MRRGLNIQTEMWGSSEEVDQTERSDGRLLHINEASVPVRSEVCQCAVLDGCDGSKPVRIEENVFRLDMWSEVGEQDMCEWAG